MTCALAFAVLAACALMSGRPFQIDEAVKVLVGRAQHPVLSAGMHAVSSLGESVGLIPLIALVSGFAWRRCRRYAGMVPVLMIGAGILQLVMKWAIDRPRPNLAPWGFPSGHVLSLVVLLGFTCYLIGVANVRRHWLCLGAILGGMTLVAVAISRLYLDVHWLSDVVGGFAIGLAYLLVVLRFFPVRSDLAPEARRSWAGST